MDFTDLKEVDLSDKNSPLFFYEENNSFSSIQFKSLSLFFTNIEKKMESEVLSSYKWKSSVSEQKNWEANIGLNSSFSIVYSTH